MSKRVLVITYYWPPAGGAGVQRWLKFVKYLPAFGWTPVIYTPANPENPVEDLSLLKDIPPEAEIIKRPIWEPYSVYKRFVGQKPEQKINAGFLSENKKPRFTEKMSVWIRGNFFIPDARRFWIRPSVKYLLAYLKEHPVDVIVSTGPPHSMHLIALALKKRLGIPWVADFRDPWTNIDFYKDLMLTKQADRCHHRLEKEVVDQCDCQIVIGEGMKKEFQNIGAKNIEVITNGFDEDDVLTGETLPDRKFSIVHIGTIPRSRNPQVLWEVLSGLLEENPELKTDLEIKLVGKLDVSVTESLEHYGLMDYLNRIEYLPHDKVSKIQREAQVLLLAVNDTPNAKNILTGKFFEYLSACRPILAIGPEDGEVARILADTGAGCISGFQNETLLRQNILRYYSSYCKGGLRIVSQGIERYSRRNLTKAMVQVFSRLLLLCLFCLLFMGFKPETWRHRQIGNSSGLSNSAVTSAFMDSRGFVWLGTWDGLNRYDGSNIRVFKPNNLNKGAISNNVIRKILEDKNHHLWIVTENGINRYNSVSEAFKSYLKNENNKFYRENCFHATLGPDLTLWVSKYDYGLVHYDDKRGVFSSPIQIRGQSNLLKRLSGFTFSKSGVLWTINDDGVVVGVKWNGQAWIVIKRYDFSNTYRVNPEKSWFINYKNGLWLLMSIRGGGLLALNPETGTTRWIFTKEEKFEVTTLSPCLNGCFIWGGTDSGGLFRLTLDEKPTIEFFQDKLSGISQRKIKIWTVTETYPDLLWVGTDGDGVHKYIMENNPFVSAFKKVSVETNKNQGVVRAIQEDSFGNLWIGTRGNGLNIYNPKGERVTNYSQKNGLSNNAVLSLGKDLYNNIWIGTDGEGIDMYEFSTKKILHFPRSFINKPKLDFGSVYAICPDSYGNIWIGTSGYGLIDFKVKRTGQGGYVLSGFKQYKNNFYNRNGLQSNVIRCITEDSPGVLWIGTIGGGLYYFDSRRNVIRSFRSSSGNYNSLQNDDVLSLWKANQRELWIGTSGGLDELRLPVLKNASFRHYNEGTGLPNNTIHSILGDSNGFVWSSTNRGLAKLNPLTGEIRRYYDSDGLQSNEYSDGASYKSRITGAFYFGGVNGFDRFDPARIRDSHYFPRLAITSFELINQPKFRAFPHMDMSRKLTLHYNQNFFQVHFTSLNYHNKQKCQYACMLENFDRGYSKVNEEVTYTNVPPGEYVLKLRCTNENGIWNPSVYEVNITILPPFWKTNWAYASYGLLIILFVLLIIRLVLMRAREQNRISMERLAVQKEKELQQYKFQFFTNIAHEFRTPLTLIMAPATQLMDLNNEDSKITPYVRSIYANCNRLLHLINELINFRKVETGHQELKVKKGNLSFLVSTIVNAFAQYAQERHIRLLFVHEGKDITGWFDNEVIETILLNLVSNALKYTLPEGTVQVSITRVNSSANIEVKDSGVGISKEYQERVFDRFFHQNDALHKSNGIFGSTGVGLSLTKSLVELHKGKMLLESAQGKGSCFTVIIPIQESSFDSSEKHEEMVIDETQIVDKAAEELLGIDEVRFGPEEEKSQPFSPLKKTILIVDDNVELRNLVHDILHPDYNVLQAQNGLEAMNVLKSTGVDLVISDIIMPEMDGLELCRTIKKDISTSHIPVILLTARGEVENRIEGLESGADSYIPKPFDPRHLKVRIRKLIESRIEIQKTLKDSPMAPIQQISGLNSRDAAFLETLRSYLEAHIDQVDLDADCLADQLAMSKAQLYRKIKAISGFTPHGYIRHYRLNKAVQLLLESSLTVSEIIFETGFNNRTYFYRCFKETYGITPKEYVKKYKG